MKIEDIGKILSEFHVKAESKINEDPNDATLRRFKEKWLFIITQLLLISVFVICIIFTFITFKNNSPYTGIALNGVIGIGLAMAGYYVRGRNL